ncbi:MAG TPA: hypothetical protein VF528_10660 [Pyrinomonadaceae bacterium]|jgi:hypothetical protein
MMLQRQHETFFTANIYSFGQDAYILTAGENPTSEEDESGLEDAARSERDYLRQRLRKELGHEPTEQELDEWLRQHTEGY